MHIRIAVVFSLVIVLLCGWLIFSAQRPSPLFVHVVFLAALAVFLGSLLAVLRGVVDRSAAELHQRDPSPEDSPERSNGQRQRRATNSRLTSSSNGSRRGHAAAW